MKGLKGNTIFPIGAFCAPQPPITTDGKEYPNKITEEQYQLLAECGVNLVYAHNEVMGTETENYAFAALDLAEKVGVKYLVRDSISKEYAATAGDMDKWFKTLTEEEKADLDQRYEQALKRYCNHPAFGGVCFMDEPGYDAFEGIARAKKVFDRVCPNKIFYVNMFPYYISPEQFQYGYWTGMKTEYKATIPEFAIREDGRNIERYKKLYEGALEVAGLEFFSYDAYPFWTVCKGAETGVHEALWEIPQFLGGMQRKNGVPFWSFLQAGGLWEGSTHVRVPTFAETSLGMGVPLLYGAKCLQVFPYAYPNDWLGDNQADAGLIDAYGNKTERYEWFKQLFTHVQSMAETLLTAKLEGVMVTGRYENGLDEATVVTQPWNECVYQGKLSNCENMTIENFASLEGLEAETQCLCGCFTSGGKECFLVLNNSTTKGVFAKCLFRADGEFEITQRAEKRTETGKAVALELAAGEFVLIRRI